MNTNNEMNIEPINDNRDNFDDFVARRNPNFALNRLKSCIDSAIQANEKISNCSTYNKKQTYILLQKIKNEIKKAEKYNDEHYVRPADVF